MSDENIPYTAIVRFNIFIHKMNPDGSLDPQIIECSEQFHNKKISNKCILQLTELGLDNCIEAVKQKLESLS